MKKILISFVLAFTVISCSETQKTEFTPEALASVLTTPDQSETTFQQVINANKGNIIVVDVWASWCSDCIKGFPKYMELQKQFPDVKYVYVSMDKEYDKWLVGIEKHELKGAHFWAKDGMQGVFGKAVNLDWIPRYMVIDQTGKVALYKAIEADDAKLIDVLENLQK
jgi:thiol-disulfide isomerase/thioredoxin